MPEGTDQGEGQQTPPPQADPPKPDKTFTQDAVDAIIADRLSRERTRFADYDALKEKAAAFDKAEAAKQSETERALADKAAAEARVTEITARANGTLKRAAILSEAALAKAHDPETVVALLVNAEGVTVDEAGNVTGVKEAVKKLLKDKPFLVAGSTSSSSGGEFGGDDGPTIDDRIADAEKKGDYNTAMALKMQRAGGIPQV